MKTYLSVPFHDKDKAKQLGARYDMSRKQWYVPDAVDLTPFLHWLPNPPRMSKKVSRFLAKTALAKTRESVNLPPAEIVQGMLKWAKGK